MSRLSNGAGGHAIVVIGSSSCRNNGVSIAVTQICNNSCTTRIVFKKIPKIHEMMLFSLSLSLSLDI